MRYKICLTNGVDTWWQEYDDACVTNLVDASFKADSDINSWNKLRSPNETMRVLICVQPCDEGELTMATVTYDGMRTYKVQVRTTNGGKDCVYNSDTKTYFTCDGGYLFVTTTQPEKIFSMLGKENVLSIELQGVGYVCEEEGKEKS